ncbi:unnamed protein product [Closterium sp. NIES-53]
MASRTLVSGLPRSLPPLPPGPAPTCVPCVEGRQRAAPHSSEFPPTEAPLQTLHMDVWGPARVRGQGHERYFLLVVDDYSRYTTVFPLRRNDRGGEFSSDLLRAFCRAEGIHQTFTLLASPQRNGIAERRIGMVMDVARISMIHAAAPHFLWPFVVQYAVHQINLQPRVSLPETTPTLRWTGKVGDATVFRVWGSQAFVRDTSAVKLSSRAVPCVFLGFPPDAPRWQFYHPTSRRVLSSQDVTFDESVSYYYPVEPVEVAVDSGAARGAEPAGAGPGGAEPGVAVSEGAELGVAEPERVEPGGAEPGGAESGGAEPGRAAGATGPAAGGASRVGAAGAGAAGAAKPGGAGAGGTGAVGGPPSVGTAGGAGAAGPGGARTGGTGAVGSGGAAGVGAVGAGAVATGGAAGAGTAGGTGAGGAAGVVAGDPGAEGTGAVSAVSGGAARPRPYYVPLLQQVLGLPPSTSPTPPLLSPPPVQGLTERREPESRPASPESRPESLVCAVRTGRRVPHQRPPLVPGTHYMTLRTSTSPQRVPLPSPPASSLHDGPDPESDSLRAASPTDTRFLATVVTDPSFESTATSALVAELVDFAAACRLDYADSLVAEFESASICPPSVGGECALGTDVLEDRQEEFECFAAALPHLVSMLLAPEGDLDAPDILTPRSYAEAIEGPYSSKWQTAMDTKMASWKSWTPPVARETVAPVAREPVAPVAREFVAPAARLAAESVTPVARVPVAPFASMPVAVVARVPGASAATHHLLSSHGPSSSSLALSFLRCAWCTPSGGIVHKVLHYRQLGGVGATRLGGAGVTAGAGGTGGAAAAGPGDARTRGTGAAGTGSVGGAGAGGAGARDPAEPGAGGAGAGDTGFVDPGARGAGAGGAMSDDTNAGGTVRPRPFFFPLLRHDLKRREPASRPASPARPVRISPRVTHPRPPPVPGTHAMALRSSSIPQCVPLPPPESSLPAIPDPKSDLARTSSPTISRLLATFVTDPSFDSTAASVLVAELVDFATACRLDYVTALVAESESAGPPSVGGECALGTDVLECLAAALPRFASMLLALEGDPDAPHILTPRSYAEAITGPYSSQWQTAMDAEMASWKSTCTYVDAVPLSGANIADGMWIFRVKRLPSSPPALKAHYVARGFSQRQGVNYFQTFPPTLKMTALWVLLHVTAQRDYELHSLDFSTAFLQGSLHKEIWLCRPPSFTGSLPAGTQCSLRRPVYGLRQAPRKWNDTLRTTLAALGFTPSTADPSLFLRTNTSMLPFYVLVYLDDLVFATADTEALTLVLLRFGFQFSSPQPTPLSNGHSLSAPPSDESVEPSGPYPELMGCLMYLMTTSGMGLVLGGRGLVVLTGHADASWVDDSATQWSSQGYTFSLGSGSISWRSTRSSSVLSSSCEAEIYAGAMAAQELRWLTYLLTDLGEQPRSPPQRGQLRLVYMATWANTADVFTKALQSGDHQRFSTVLGLLHTLPHFLTA